VGGGNKLELWTQSLAQTHQTGFVRTKGRARFNSRAGDPNSYTLKPPTKKRDVVNACSKKREFDPALAKMHAQTRD
jgi:hypothetical protein